MKKLFAIFILLLGMTSAAMAQVVTTWLSNAVVPGEQTRMFIILTDGSIARTDPLPKVKGASLRWVNQGNYIRWPNSPNQSAFLMAIEVTPDEVGTVHIPSLALTTNNGGTYTTAPQTLTVYPYSAIKWNSLNMDGAALTYGMLWHVDNQTPYVHQPDRCELKIYAPENILEYSIPAITTSNLAAWRFEPALAELFRGQPHGSLLYKKDNYNVITFHSTLFPLRAGEVTAAGTISARAVLPEADPIIASFSRMDMLVEMVIPQVKITARELPPGAPASFTNAVGQFRISATTDARDLSANEPITVKIKVEGSGNIHSLACPALTDTANWKLYPANKLEAGQNTRTTQGTVEFQQMMRPVSQTDAIPAFALTFFNPETQQYQTVTTAPIPLEWKASAITGAAAGTGAPATPPPAGTIPVAEMTDIYGMAPASIMAALASPIHWGWYFLAYIPASALLGMALIRRIRRLRQDSFTSRERLRSFKQLSAGADQAGPTEFLRAAGNFIESNIPAARQDDDMKKILQLRDDRAFTPSSANDELPRQERQRILHAIRKTIGKLPLLLAMALLGISLTGMPAQAEDDNQGVKAYEQGEYSRAVEHFQSQRDNPSVTRPDRAYALFGLGDAYYRLNKPGMAALSYRRALELSPYFTEAEYNLKFIERKEGAVLPPDTTENQWLTYLHHDTLVPIAILAGAVMLTFLALLTVTRRHGVLLTIMATLSGLVTVAAVMNYCMYPETPESIPADRLLIVTQKTPARHAADLDSPAVMTLPPSTPLILRAERGSWYYASTFQNTPVWVPKADVQPL